MEMFVCTQYGSPVKMLPRACIARQQRAHENIDATGSHVRYLPMSFEKCINCEQGRKIMEENKSTVGAEVGVQNFEPLQPETRDAQPETRPALRTCKKCGEEKPLSEFPKNEGCKDGRENRCKACRIKRVKEIKALKKATVGAKPCVRPAGTTDMPRPKNTQPPRHYHGLTDNHGGDNGRSQDGRTQDGRTQGSPLQRQVGGDHYKTFAIQPIEFSTRNGLGFIQGDIVKRICRYNRPGGKGLEDLLKIIHEVELLMEMEGLS